LKKTIVIFIILLSATSCSSGVGVIVGGSRIDYKETFSGSSSYSIGSTSTTGGFHFPDYNNHGFGFHVGVSDEAGLFFYKILYYSNSYQNKKYNLDGVDYDTEVSENGFRTDLGIKLWYFQPFLSLRTVNGHYKVNQTESEDDFLDLGFGLNFEVNITDKSYLALTFVKYNYKETSTSTTSGSISGSPISGSSSTVHKIDHLEFGLSYRIILW